MNVHVSSFCFDVFPYLHIWIESFQKIRSYWVVSTFLTICTNPIFPIQKQYTNNTRGFWWIVLHPCSALPSGCKHTEDTDLSWTMLWFFHQCPSQIKHEVSRKTACNRCLKSHPNLLRAAGVKDVIFSPNRRMTHKPQWRIPGGGCVICCCLRFYPWTTLDGCWLIWGACKPRSWSNWWPNEK